MDFSSSEFQEAYNRISTRIRPTILYKSEWLSQELKAEVYLKLECFNPGRSFKIRGALNALLSQEDKPIEVITASGGNHGIGVALACQSENIPCKVVLPINTSPYRIGLLTKIGATVELVGDAWDEANKYAKQLSKDTGSLYIHPFADKEVILGQGTIILEVLKELPDFDSLVASVGGGGLLTGMALALDTINKSKDIDITSVETKGADCFAVSRNAGHLVELNAITSIAKTLGAKQTTPFIFNTLDRLVNNSLVVSDKEAIESLILFLDQEKILVEPATACIIAAVLKNKQLFKDKRVVLIICGSNVLLSEVFEWRSQFEVDY